MEMRWIRRVSSKIDAVLLSHSDTLHLGALPYAMKHLGLSAPVYSTEPVYRLGLLTMYDHYLSRKVSFFFLAYLMSICWRTFRSYGSYMAMIIWSFVNWFILMAIQVAKNKSIFCNVSCTNVGWWDSWNWLREVRQVCYDWRWYCNVIWYQCHGRWMPFLKEISDLA